MTDAIGKFNSRRGNNYSTFDGRNVHTYSSSRRLRKNTWVSNPRIRPSLIPGDTEDEHGERDILGNDIVEEDRIYSVGNPRGVRRRIFLFLTEPSSSWLSAAFFFILVVAISISNLIMIMQTMPAFQYKPTECNFCAVDGEYYADLKAESENVVECVCPLRPILHLERVLRYLLDFFALEWTLRVLTYVPANPRFDLIGQCSDWFKYLTSTTTVMDALATWPYFMERFDVPGLISLRLLRLFRVFQIIRLGSYNSMFVSLTKVIQKSIAFLKLMIVIMFFGATIFGSLLFWLEQGKWKYWEPTGDFQYIRIGIDGVSEEISPFSSIPAAFWWFVVTATTVGYGDYYPTSTAGQWVSALAMLTGVLVIAFPVSIFSDLWSEELREVKGLECLFDDDSSDDEDNKNGGSNEKPKQESRDSSIPYGSLRFRKEYQTLRLEEDILSTHLVIERDDVREIVSSIRDIHEKQRRIQRILKKYLIQEEG